MLETSLKNNNANKGPLKMNNLGKIIWLTLVVFMIAVLVMQYSAINGDKNESPKPQPQITANVAESQEQTKQDDDMEQTIAIDIQDGFKLETHISLKQSIGICKVITPQQHVSLEIKPYAGDYGEYTENLASKQESGEIEIKTTPYGLRYWEDNGWNSTPGVLIEGNVHREFFMEKEGKVITMLEYDYAGGVMDKEIEKIVEGITVIEDTWE